MNKFVQTDSLTFLKGLKNNSVKRLLKNAFEICFAISLIISKRGLK